MIHIKETVKRYQTINRNYYSFKIFLSFLLAQILRLILTASVDQICNTFALYGK